MEKVVLFYCVSLEEIGETFTVLATSLLDKLLKYSRCVIKMPG